MSIPKIELSPVHQPEVEPAVGLVMRLNVPLWFKCPSFLQWLNSSETVVFTWHSKGEKVDEYSDIVVGLEPCLNGEGTNSDMPAFFWEQIVEAAREKLGANKASAHYMVQLTNLNTNDFTQADADTLELLATEYQAQLDQS